MPPFIKHSVFEQICKIKIYGDNKFLIEEIPFYHLRMMTGCKATIFGQFCLQEVERLYIHLENIEDEEGGEDVVIPDSEPLAELLNFISDGRNICFNREEMSFVACNILVSGCQTNDFLQGLQDLMNYQVNKKEFRIENIGKSRTINILHFYFQLLEQNEIGGGVLQSIFRRLLSRSAARDFAAGMLRTISSPYLDSDGNKAEFKVLWPQFSDFQGPKPPSWWHEFYYQDSDEDSDLSDSDDGSINNFSSSDEGYKSCDNIVQQEQEIPFAEY